MKQVVSKISTYSSDEFGVCSALYELGGMVVIHDASGCNSTYTTHDEPRWYDMDSMIYISAISEMEAIMGDDEKFINDLVCTANKLRPAFIALVGAPIPYMIGTDLEAVAKEVNRRCKIPSFSFPTNGMQYYTKGISMALVKLVEQYILPSKVKKNTCHEIVVNILGATPLDFSINSTIDSIKNWIYANGMKVGCCLAMGSQLEEIQKAKASDVNLVISTGGLKAAQLMEEKLSMPYVVGVPYGREFSILLANKIKLAYEKGTSMIAYEEEEPSQGGQESQIVIIGENVISASLAAALESELKQKIRVLCPLGSELLRKQDQFTPEEEDLIRALEKAQLVIADPLYQALCKGKELAAFYHVAFSGRIGENKIPDLICHDNISQYILDQKIRIDGQC